MATKLTDEQREKIGQLVGEATMLWNPRPTGVFESQEASDVLNKIYAVIEETE